MKKLLFLLGLAPTLLLAGPSLNSSQANALIKLDSDARAFLTSSHIQYASLTVTSTATVNGLTVVAAVAGKTIAVVGWSVSTDTACKIILHHQSGTAVRDNTASNIFGGGVFGANGGERGNPGFCWYPGLGTNQPICADVSTNVTAIEIDVAYVTY
jgi:hypothetical protein